MTTIAQNTRIGARLKAVRQEKGLRQAMLATAMGFRDRQTLSAIESGKRRISPEELVSAAEALAVDVDIFLDPYRLVGEGRFSFRAKDVEPDVLMAFEDQAGRWIALYRELLVQSEAEISPLGQRLELIPESSFEEAVESAEALWRQWDLGDLPAARLESAIERHLGAMVLYVDAPREISGAASRLPRHDTILINRQEPIGRRSFDLAHELFHILTWDAMPPRRVDSPEVSKTKGNRVEHLADNFAAALLMPSPIILHRWDGRKDESISDWIARTAIDLRVSASSLKWRLVNMKLLSKKDAGALQLKKGHPARSEEPLLFSERFIALVSDAVNTGRLSLRRAATLLQLTVSSFAQLCTAHGRPLAYDLEE